LTDIYRLLREGRREDEGKVTRARSWFIRTDRVDYGSVTLIL
jgi:hypothetical protein